MKACSVEYALVTNLYNAAVQHKATCNECCNVSLFQMREAAKHILQDKAIDTDEWETLSQLLAVWPV